MKKNILLCLLSVAMLTACGGTSASSQASNEAKQPKTFAEQLALANIDFDYVDINAAVSVQETKPTNPEDIDLVTGSSGAGFTDFYGNGGSYYTLDRMVERANLQYYYSITWVEKDEKTTAPTAKTLKEASELEDAKYVSEVFPNDGKEYFIQKKSNAVATKTVITSDAEGKISAAIYGMGAKKIENNYYITGVFTSKNTTKNLVQNGKGLIYIYEYDFRNGNKQGAGSRNYGCRVEVSLDTTLSTFGGKDLTDEQKAITIGQEYPDYASSLSVYLKVDRMLTLG